MKLSIRTRPGAGYWKEVENQSKTHCDTCGARLWANPAGDPYCNNWSADHDQPGRYSTLDTLRQGNVTTKLIFDATDNLYRLEWIRASSDSYSNDGDSGEEEYPTLAQANRAFSGTFERHALKAEA